MMEENIKTHTWKWNENFFWYMVTAFLLTLAGEIIGILLVQVPAFGVMGFTEALSGTSVEDIVQGHVSLSPFADAIVMYLMPIGTWIVCLLHFRRKNNRPIMKCFTPYCNGNNLKMFLFGLALGFLSNGACILGAFLHGDIQLAFDSLPWGQLLVVLVCVFVQSSSEEILCRGYLYQKLMHRYNNPVIAIGINSLFFACLHLGNPSIGVVAFIDLLLSGLIFSVLVYYFDSIWAAFAMHTAWNFTQNILFGLPNSGLTVGFSVFRLAGGEGRDSFFYNAGFGVEGTWFAVLIEAALLAALIAYGRKKKKKPTNIWKAE